jgi:predicted nucleic acid-binding protein
VKVLLDTNIVIHREAAIVVHEDIGILFRWLDNLNHNKCIHPVTAKELEKHKNPRVRKSLKIKLANYNVLKTKAPVADKVRTISQQLDENQNDLNDTLIINELYSDRVDALITEDKRLLIKASLLGITDRVYTIDAFLEKVTAENPELADYKVLSVQKDYFGNLDLADEFFATLKDDYPGFENWFNRKADETVYVCRSEGKPIALLYLKVEGEGEDYTDIDPPLQKKRRLKIGTFKVALNGFRLGERFLKIVFDNACRLNVDEIYVTTFDKRIEQQRLINLFEEYGFKLHGHKSGLVGGEGVYVRSFARAADRSSPKLTYPFFSTAGRIFIVSIYPEYHTELFPDSILRTESPANFVENEPHRNAISKVYISRSIERSLEPGDVIVFYRTGGYYKGVVTTVGVVESVIDNIGSEADFVRLCRKRSVFTDQELSRHWNYKKRNRPFIVNFLYAYSFPRRINMKRLIDIGVISGIDDAPRGFTQISAKNLKDILRECQSDESIIVD